MFKVILEGAGLKFNSPENLLPLLDHKGAHSGAYWEGLLAKLTNETKGLESGSKAYGEVVRGVLADEVELLIRDPKLLKGKMTE